MSGSVRVLTASVQGGRPFRAGSLVLQPSHARSALALLESLSGPAREWFERQSPMRMVFMGEAAERPAPARRRERKAPAAP